MNQLGITVVLVLLVGAWAQINVLRPECDSPEAEEVALVAQDYLNAQHKHGYKYVLNRIEDIKILTKPDGDNTYVVEVDLLETDCHVLDPTPLANCTVRPKVLTAVEGDCDVVLKKVDGALAVTAFKCKTEESTEDLCLGCPTLLPLNDTAALDFVHTSLATFTNNTVNMTLVLLEVGRMSSQIVSGGPIYSAEYVVAEAACADDVCMLLNDTMAARGICSAKGSKTDHTVDCKMFSTMMPLVDGTSAAAATAHVLGASLSRKHGLRHHKLTALHDPHLSGLLSAESAESAEVVPAAAAPAAADPAPAAADPAPAATDPAPAAADPAPAGDAVLALDDSASAEVPVLVMKRDVAAVVAGNPANGTNLVPLVPVCPGKVRFF